MKPCYSLERWPLGWTIKAPYWSKGITIPHMMEITNMLNKKNIISHGIAHHLKQTHDSQIVMVVALPHEATQWENQIEDHLKETISDPELRWWHGTCVGLSSASIFSALCSSEILSKQVAAFAQGAHPHDADDFLRCTKLLDIFPEWKNRLCEVANKWTQTPWAELVKYWDLISTSPDKSSTISEICHR